ncbi:hypothetical protein HYH03_007548 [Edaphochlamys debaryana]|uniref:Uncharacterized protein n=1 Tax=Edaphochlamys debaryana TaxID=47281 RepID=A0A835Y1M2_9CHLO|nr:hypothetical protein HYH03_007548 [Edaphochlamys debaryana]|eukprot:KAG2494190.1 hypothetical protein HYH03_007548 [Edaphochlamys debaryana]
MPLRVGSSLRVPPGRPGPRSVGPAAARRGLGAEGAEGAAAGRAGGRIEAVEAEAKAQEGDVERAAKGEAGGQQGVQEAMAVGRHAGAAAQQAALQGRVADLLMGQGARHARTSLAMAPRSDPVADVWRSPELLGCIAPFLDPSHAAWSFIRVNKAAAAAAYGDSGQLVSRTVSLSWALDSGLLTTLAGRIHARAMCYRLTYKQRVKLLCRCAATDCSWESLEGAVVATGLSPPPTEMLVAAASVGRLATCRWLVQGLGCPGRHRLACLCLISAAGLGPGLVEEARAWLAPAARRGWTREQEAVAAGGDVAAVHGMIGSFAAGPKRLCLALFKALPGLLNAVAPGWDVSRDCVFRGGWPSPAAAAGCEAAVAWVAAETGLESKTDAYVMAAYHGDLRMVQRLRKLGCPYDARDAEALAEAARRVPAPAAALPWLEEPGCPVSFDAAAAEAKAEVEGHVRGQRRV